MGEREVRACLGKNIKKIHSSQLQVFLYFDTRQNILKNTKGKLV